MTGTAGGAPERLARATLSRLAEPGDPRLGRAVATHGAVAVVEAVRAGDTSLDGAAEWAVRLAAVRPEVDLERADRAGIRLVCPGEPEWPAGLDALADAPAVNRRGGPPVALWVRGPTPLDVAATRAVAVVGSRAATDYGQYVAGELAAGLVSHAACVISGAAYGIDAAAHRGALAADGSTVAVLACGVDLAYPAGNAALLSRIADEGALVSELPPGCSPTRLRFLARNRLIAGLAQATVVVEAALRSGALNSATWTNELGRPLAAVPGPVTSPASAGTHRLLRDAGATLVTDADDVAELVAPMGETLAPVRRGEARPRDRLDERAQRVLDAVPAVSGRGPASIAGTAGVPVGEVLAVLGTLALAGFVERSGAGWRLSAAERGAARRSD